MGLLNRLFGRGKSGVKFVRRYSEEKLSPHSGRMLTFHYEVYEAATAQEARTFLESKTVTEKYTYISVHTPEGNWGKDNSSMYKEE